MITVGIHARGKLAQGLFDGEEKLIHMKALPGNKYPYYARNNGRPHNDLGHWIVQGNEKMSIQEAIVLAGWITSNVICGTYRQVPDHDEVTVFIDGIQVDAFTETSVVSVSVTNLEPSLHYLLK